MQPAMIATELVRSNDDADQPDLYARNVSSNRLLACSLAGPGERLSLGCGLLAEGISFAASGLAAESW